MATRALPGGIPNSKIVRRGIYTPDVGYSPDEITAFGRQMQASVDAAARGWRARSELGRGVRQPLRQAGRGGERHPFLQGAVRRRAARVLSRRRRGRARGGERLPDRVPARRRRSLAQSATSPTSSRRVTGCRSKTSTATAAATKGGSSRDPTPRTTSITATIACSSSRRACCRTRSAASISSAAGRTAASTGASTTRKRPRRTRSARDALRDPVHRRHAESAADPGRPGR